MSDPVEGAGESEKGRRRFVLEDGDFNEVPQKYRRFYRHWKGPGDPLGPNEVICPVCKIVIRSTRELRPGDRVYCMACMTRLRVVQNAQGNLEGECEY
jgi:hypothetical protein